MNFLIFYSAMDINLRSMIQVSQIVIRRMIEQKSGGSIVNISSVVSEKYSKALQQKFILLTSARLNLNYN